MIVYKDEVFIWTSPAYHNEQCVRTAYARGDAYSGRVGVEFVIGISRPSKVGDMVPTVLLTVDGE